MEKIGAGVFVETVYPGVNVGCIVTNEGAVCVDTPLLPGEAQRWRARIRSLDAEPVRFVVYTTGQSDRVLGTQYLIFDQQVPRDEQVVPVSQPSRSRRGLFPHLATALTPDQGMDFGTGTVVAQRLAWEQIRELATDSFKQAMVDMLGDRDPDMANLKVVLPQITFDDYIKLYAGDVTVTLLAAAGGVLWVWLPERRVLFVGDTVVVGTHPPLSIADIQEWVTALERLCQESQFRDVVVVPGRGPLCDTSAAKPLIEYLRIAREKTLQVYRSGRPKAELNGVASELVPLYPVADGQRERVQRQIKLGLDDLYDEFKATEATVE